jgi:hypothetical protein
VFQRNNNSVEAYLDNIKIDRKEIGYEDVDWIIWLRIESSGGPL